MAVVRAEPISDLGRQREVSIRFVVRITTTAHVVDDGLGGAPSRWAAPPDMSAWALFGAYEDDRRVGGAVVALDTPSPPRSQAPRRSARLRPLLVGSVGSQAAQHAARPVVIPPKGAAP